MSSGIAFDRWAWRGGDATLQGNLAAVAARLNALPGVSIGDKGSNYFVSQLLDNPRIPNSYFAAIFDLTPRHWEDFGRAHPEPNSRAAFPNRLQIPDHQVAMDNIYSLHGGSRLFYSDIIPGNGFTGADNKILTLSNELYLRQGTQLHDLTSTYDLILRFVSETDSDFAAEHGEAVSSTNLNAIIYGSPSIELSAILMGMEQYAKSIADLLIPSERDLFSFLGPWVTKEDILRLAIEDDLAYYKDVTKLGNSAAYIASTLAYHYGASDAASQIATRAFARTLGGYLGDLITFDVTVGASLPAKVVFTRFFGDFARSSAELAGDVLTRALSETFDLDNPLGQYFATSVTSAALNVFLDEAIDVLVDGPLSSLGVTPEFAKQVLGLGPVDLEFSRVLLAGELFDSLQGSFFGFTTGQLFQWLDRQWTTFDLSNLGASIGGIIGSFIAPGIGSFIGQVAGGIVFDIFDGDPRSFHQVRFDEASGLFVTEFVFERDRGQFELSRTLAESAMGSIQLAIGIIGGEMRGIRTFEYGHYNEELVFAPYGSGRVEFSDATSMLDRGVLAQLRTMEVEGGNLYAKDLLTRTGYDPTLSRFFADLGVADVYNIHKADPSLFGTQIANIADQAARRLVLVDWQKTLAAAHALGFQALPFNDGGEFLVRVDGSAILSGGLGDDMIYAEAGAGRIDGGAGNDLVRVSSRILTNGNLDDISGGSGFDRFFADFSDYQEAEGDVSRVGISFGGDFLDELYLGNVNTAYIWYFEQFSFIGTRYDDHMDITDAVIEFDGGDGVDTIDVSLGSATSSIKIDLGSENQISYRSFEIRNVERLGDVSLGSGDDEIHVGSFLLSDDATNDILGGSGFDRFFADFSDYQKAEGDVSRVGISFGGDFLDELYLGNVNTAYIWYFEQFSFIGTQYDDKLTGASRNDAGDSLSGGAGSDTLGGRNGNDLLDGGIGNDSLDGGDGADMLDGGAGNDSLSGGAGADSLLGDTGDDRFDGGSGNDWLDFAAASLAVTVDLQNGSATGFFGTDLVVSIEAVLGGSGDDSLRGGTGANTLEGAAGADRLDGGTNNDSLSGGAGADTLLGDAGNDSLDGGSDKDWLSFTAATSAVTVDLQNGSATGFFGADQVVSFEAVLGGNAADSLRGSSSNETLLGGNGADTLDGGAGADLLGGGAGNDLFFITSSGDLVLELADGGADTIITAVNITLPDHVEALCIAEGVSGITVTGGAGNDMLIGNGLANTFNGGAGDDVILTGNVTLADIYALFNI